jgi:hypothetical protein
MAAEPMLNDANLEALCNVPDDTGTGLTGSEIGRYLRDCGIADPLFAGRQKANVRPGVHILRHTFCSPLAMRGRRRGRFRSSPATRTSLPRSATCT